MTLVNDFQSVIAASKQNYNHPNPAEKDKTCVSSQINFDILIRRPNLTIPYQIFPIMISIFDMCRAREDCSDFFLILVQDFFYLQLKGSTDTTVLCKKIQHPTTLRSVSGLTLNFVAVGRFQQKQTVEHLEGLVIGTGIPGLDS